MKSIAKKALKLIQPIPQEAFITGAFTDRKDKCCVMGHIQRLTSSDPNDYSSKNTQVLVFPNQKDFTFAEQIYKKSAEFLSDATCSIIGVNNGISKRYSQPTIKGRSVALLEDMIKAGY